MHIAQETAIPIIDISLDTLLREKQALIFVSSKASAQKQALDIAKAITKSKNTKLAQLTQDCLVLSQELLTVLATPTEQCKKLAQCVKCSVAFHHAGLHPKQKTLIEDAFRAGLIKIISSTPTLAAGLDMPAFRAIIKDVRRFSGSWGMQFLPVLEVAQMAGRAGRPGKEDYGEAILIAASENERDALVERFIYGDIESIYSKLASEPVLRMYVLSLIATGIVRDEESVVSFFAKSFWAHQYQDLPKLHSIITRVISLLVEYGFLESSQPQKTTQKDEGDISAFETAASLLGDAKKREPVLLNATQLGHRVAQLYMDPLSAHILCTGIKKAQAQELTSEFALFSLANQTLEMRPYLRVKKKETDDINQFLFSHEEELLTKIPTIYDVDYEDFFDSIKTTMYFMDWISEISENELLEKYDIRPGEISAKNDMMDWVLYCAIELARLLHTTSVIAPLVKLQKRIQYGAKGELLPLLELKQVGKIRARILHNAGYSSISLLKKANFSEIAKLVGLKIAQTIAKQLGLDETKITHTAGPVSTQDNGKSEQRTLFDM